MTKNNVLRSIGQVGLLEKVEKGFLCSRKVHPEVILLSYDWALQQKNLGICVISGFHSKLEKDVFHFLLKGTQPLIMVLARGMYKKWDLRIKARLEAGNMLVISPFSDSVTKITPRTCAIRNQLIIELADRLVIGYADQNGTLVKLLAKTTKQIEYLF